jgi:energy-coupling factor transporter ATP-binding protein EcfA2
VVLTIPYFFPQSNIKKQVRIAINPSEPPEVACPLISQKLKSPMIEFENVESSITLLQTCIAYGEARAEEMKGKDSVIIIGNTGAGKSTTINYLAGCTMRCIDPLDMDLPGLESLIVVTPVSEGGARDEVMQIGHSKTSMTFLPQVESVNGITYCDCPGFLDNRGAEINIANAVNIRCALGQAKSIRVLILINYHSLLADRAKGLSDTIKICTNLFGDVQKLIQSKDSILVGISRLPRRDLSLEKIKAWICEGTGNSESDEKDLVRVLCSRIFMFDPLTDGKTFVDRLGREEILKQISSLAPLNDPGQIFKTVLLDSDEKKMLQISDSIGSSIEKFLLEKDVFNGSASLQQLASLNIIQHPSISRIIQQAEVRIITILQQRLDEIKQLCSLQSDFVQAEKQIDSLENDLSYFQSFPRILEALHLQGLKDFFLLSQQQYQERMEMNKKYEEELAKSRSQMDKYVKMLDLQKMDTARQLREQEEKFSILKQDMEEDRKKTVLTYENLQKQLFKEMEDRLLSKEKELQLALRQNKINKEDYSETLQDEKKGIKKEYQKKIQDSELEKEKILEEKEKRKQQLEDEAMEKARALQQKIEALTEEIRIEEEQRQKLKNEAYIESKFHKGYFTSGKLFGGEWTCCKARSKKEPGCCAVFYVSFELHFSYFLDKSSLCFVVRRKEMS